jgi:hypothetical protein
VGKLVESFLKSGLLMFFCFFLFNLTVNAEGGDRTNLESCFANFLAAHLAGAE